MLASLMLGTGAKLVCTHADTAGAAWRMLMQAYVLGFLDSTEQCQAVSSMYASKSAAMLRMCWASSAAS